VETAPHEAVDEAMDFDELLLYGNNDFETTDHGLENTFQLDENMMDPLEAITEFCLNMVPSSSRQNSFTASQIQTPISVPFSDTNLTAYNNLLGRGPALIDGQNSPQIYGTNSLFSDHIGIVEYLVKQKWQLSQAMAPKKDAWYVWYSVSYQE
jgi:hypothetical protein